MKAFGAAAASFGSVALFHIIGATPEADTCEDAFQNAEPTEIIDIGPEDVQQALTWLSTSAGGAVSAVGIGSPHLSLAEFESLLSALHGRNVRMPFYANTGRHVVRRLDELGYLKQLEDCGIRSSPIPASSPRRSSRTGTAC